MEAGRSEGEVPDRDLAEIHGGHIDVETAEGRGTTMRVWLPPTPTARGTA